MKYPVNTKDVNEIVTLNITVIVNLSIVTSIVPDVWKIKKYYTAAIKGWQKPF